MDDTFIVIHLCISGMDYNVRMLSPNADHPPWTLLDYMLMAKTDKQKKSICHYYQTATGKFHFYGVSTTVFESVLDFQYSRRLLIPKSICPMQTRLELKLWNVPFDEDIFNIFEDEDIPNVLECNLSEIPKEKVKEKDLFKGSVIKPNMFDNVVFGDFRRKVWLVLEDMSSSCTAKAFAAISLSLSLLSIVIMLLESLPQFKENSPSQANVTPVCLHNGTENKTGAFVEQMPLFHQIEFMCIIWFTFEFLLRFVVTPKKLIYMKGPMQIVDILTILPFYVELASEEIIQLMQESYPLQLSTSQMAVLHGFLALRVLRVLRSARVFRFARYHTGLHELMRTFFMSKAECNVLAVFFTATVLLFGTTLYFLERDYDGTPFTSIPKACWWCAITITTIGYGDTVPATIQGKCVASACCLAGAIIISFPITCIIENFDMEFKSQIALKEAQLLHRKSQKYEKIRDL